MVKFTWRDSGRTAVPSVREFLGGSTNPAVMLMVKFIHQHRGIADIFHMPIRGNIRLHKPEIPRKKNTLN